jgi:hypothetical protein
MPSRFSTDSIKSARLLRRDFDGGFRVDVDAGERIERQALVGQTHDFGARRRHEIRVVRHVAFGIIEKDKIDREIRFPSHLRQQIFDKLRLPASRLARHGEIAVRPPVKLDADRTFVFPTDLQIEQTAESQSRLNQRRGFLVALFQSGSRQFDEIINVIVFGLKTGGVVSDQRKTVVNVRFQKLQNLVKAGFRLF